MITKRPSSLLMISLAVLSFLVASAATALCNEAQDEAFKTAMQLFFRGDSYTSRDLLTKNIAENPNHSISYSGMAFIHMMGLLDPLYDGDPKVAQDNIKKALETGPDNKWNHLSMAVLAASQYIKGDLGALLRIEKESKTASKLSPQSGEPHYFLWFINKFIRHNEKAADASYAASSKNGFEFANVHYMNHYAESFFGSCDDAVAEAQLGVSQDPASRPWYIDWEKKPGGDTATVALADCLYWKAEVADFTGGGPAEQVEFLKQSLQKLPGFFFAANKLESILCGSNRCPEAGEIISKGYESNRNDFAAAFAMAEYYATYAPDNAKLKEVLTAFPNLPESPYRSSYVNRLAGYYEKLGDTESAKRIRELK